MAPNSVIGVRMSGEQQRDHALDGSDDRDVGRAAQQVVDRMLAVDRERRQHLGGVVDLVKLPQQGRAMVQRVHRGRSRSRARARSGPRTAPSDSRPPGHADVISAHQIQQRSVRQRRDVRDRQAGPSSSARQHGRRCESPVREHQLVVEPRGRMGVDLARKEEAQGCRARPVASCPDSTSAPARRSERRRADRPRRAASRRRSAIPG